VVVGVGAYLGALFRRITTPRLEKLEIWFFNQPTFSIPRLLPFVNAADNLRFKSAKFNFFNKRVDVEMYPHEEAEMYVLSITVNCCHLDWQVSSVAQISNSLSPTLFAVEHLTLEHEVHSQSSEEHNEVDRTEWHKLLRSFRNVKTLRIAEGLVEELSRCLEFDDGELPLDLLPELQELTYSGSGKAGNRFTSFIDARQDTGRSITLVRRSPSPDPALIRRSPNPDPSSSMSSIEPSSITPASGEAGVADLESGSHMRTSERLSIADQDTPTYSHLHRSRDVLVEDLATPNIP